MRTCTGMKHKLAEACLKRSVEPSQGSVLDCQRPEDNPVPTIELSLQTGKLSLRSCPSILAPESARKIHLLTSVATKQRVAGGSPQMKSKAHK